MSGVWYGFSIPWYHGIGMELIYHPGMGTPKLDPHKGGHCGNSSTKLASIVSPNYFALLRNKSPTIPSPPSSPEPQYNLYPFKGSDSRSLSKPSMFGKQPCNISSRSSSSSTTSITRRLNIVDGSKLPPGLNKPISQTIAVLTVATSPVTAEGLLTTPREITMDTSSRVEGKRKLWQPSNSSPLSFNPLDRPPVFVAPPPNSIQFHSPPEQFRPNSEADTTFEINVTTTLQEAESTPRPSQYMCRGMENGYSLSPMYSLWLEYCDEGESSKSTQSRVMFYATKPSLARDEVIDRGPGSPTQHYMVDKTLFEQIVRTVNELQVFIQHMAGLIEERTKYFQVDPDNTLLKVLEGAETTSQLHATWLCLTNDKLWYIHGTIPRHADKLSLDARHRLTETNEKWEKIIPAPPWLAAPAQKTSPPISKFSAWTSYKAASSFTLPDELEPTAPIQKKQALTTWKNPKAVQFAPQVEALEPSQSSALMSSGTPFKSSKGLFSQDEGSNPGPFPLSGPNQHVSLHTRINMTLIEKTMVIQTEEMQTHQMMILPAIQEDMIHRGIMITELPITVMEAEVAEEEVHLVLLRLLRAPLGLEVVIPIDLNGTKIVLPPYIKLEQLPTWDGNHDTAINYFWKIQQLAAMKGYLPQVLGYWLWMNLKEDSTVRMWFAMCSQEQQEYMRSHYIAYMRGIKEGYLGRTWQMKMNATYENQSFQQVGHEREDPRKFIIRRIMYTRMLVNGDMGGPLEVFLVMQRAPVSWGSVINIDSIRLSNPPNTSSSVPSLIDEGILKEVYQVLLKRQRPPPPRGYPFKQNDHVNTKMGRLPPSPCKVCGIPNHWDKECPDWNVYLETRNRSAHFTVGQSDDEPELEEKYCTAYAVLLNNRVAEQLIEMDEPSPFSNDQDFREAVMMSLVRQSSQYSHGHKSYKWKEVSMEEVPDKDEEKMRSMLTLKEDTHVLEDVMDDIVSTSNNIQHTLQPHVTEIEDEDDICACSKPTVMDPRYILEGIDKSKGGEPPPTLLEPNTNERNAFNAHGNSGESRIPEKPPDTCKDFTLPLRDIPGPPTPLK
ncbi:uncharacterized protein LACBIDRAFT_330428 [Laccaria bicolor S238N-H82]|uniref:Predicted protein n=1 Tax=Laccaria bicolor (strain S238N-H82 / ATCC MYA-4686) TaxID=486041 RepID=B0DL99_LACBS|nr:uncharacterized protein LACBIDRAFT_330428 [Laccaria bicolor S238N-H82]EDR04615.1 predicted protein [Laccaria bicolor S238N-H82]|eukprot:XP_001884787.1 predicted protein [Laccaria bicolor S238N-H82]